MKVDWVTLGKREEKLDCIEVENVARGIFKKLSLRFNSRSLKVDDSVAGKDALSDLSRL